MGEYPVRSDSMIEKGAEVGVTSNGKYSNNEIRLIFYKGIGVAMIAAACFLPRK